METLKTLKFPVEAPKAAKPEDCVPVFLPHAEPGESIARKLNVDISSGLSAEEAELRLLRDGENKITHAEKRRLLRLLLSQFSSLVVWLLALASVIAWFTENRLEALAIVVVLLLNAAIGFLIEWQAGRALDALKKAAKTTARVRRENREEVIGAEGLVAGDIIILNAGMRVPADARIYESANLQANESSLTGESLPAEKSHLPAAPSAPIAERHSMLYLGTTIASGNALAIVSATGANTELGRIGRLVAEADTAQTPLQRRLEGLGRRLIYVVLGLAALVFAAGIIRGDETWLMLEVSISLAVAAVPEGLPAVTTLILALGVLKMARRNAIVRRLAAVETLGSATVICTDKTGTLTENRMTVQEYVLANGRRVASHQESGKDENFTKLLRVSLLCNNAAIRSAEEEEIGDPTESALLVAVHRFGLDVLEERAKFRKLHEIPFESKTKRMTTVMRGEEGDFAALKGAPAIILEACSNYINEKNQIAPLDEKARKLFFDINEEMAGRALRVLAFAEKGKVSGPDDIESGFTFLGFAGMSDPPREGAAEAIAQAHSAGIRVVMLTGDQVNTARAIAKKLNLSKGADIFALHSGEMAEAVGEKLGNMARQAHVFARVSPEDKLRIVKALQGLGEIVAVTGDGVNDAPALKQADIGISMGCRGTEVAKEASDIVLTDDNFSTIVSAIEGGRTIYANIIKFVHLMFSKNLAEVLLIFACIIFGLPLPLFPLQILWLNLVTDVFPALSLAVEPPRKETMMRGPNPPNEALLSGKFMFLILWQGAMLSLFALAAYLWAFAIYGEGAHSRTLALFAVVSGQLGHLFNCRSRTRSAFSDFFGNPYVFLAIANVVLLQFLAVYFSPLAVVLDIVPLSGADWAIIGLSFLLPVLVVEAAKAAKRKWR